jgi:flagellar biosynthesis anti-sigma factor FlgM
MITTYEDNVMVNQINNFNNKPINGGNDNKSVPNEPENKPVSSEDSISLSDTAKHLDNLKALVEDVPTVDMEKVEAIKNELKEGYKANSEEIAKRILEDFGA